MLLLCCIDGSIIIYDQTRATTTSVKAVFVSYEHIKFNNKTKKIIISLNYPIFKIPTLASWHSDGIIFVVGNDKGQLQHFDIALNCIKSQTLSEEAVQANILDLSSYFRYYFNSFFIKNNKNC